MYMSSIYENELQRLIKEDMTQIRMLSRENKESKKLKILKGNVVELKNELTHFQKAMDHFRKKPVAPVSNPSPSN